MKRAYRSSGFAYRAMKMGRLSHMKKTLLSGCLIVLMMTACGTQDKKTMLTGKWQAIGLENPQLDSLMAEQNRFLDTFGSNTTPEENLIIYGFTNLDSIREVSKKEMAEYLAMQDHAVKNTWFEFRKDGVAIMNFSGQIDSTQWQIDDEGKLVLDELAGGDETEKISMDILSLSDTTLKLQMTERGMSSIVIFKPADNK